MKFFYTTPETTELIVLRTEDSLCLSKTIPNAGGEDRDPWEED